MGSQPLLWRQAKGWFLRNRRTGWIKSCHASNSQKEEHESTVRWSCAYTLWVAGVVFFFFWDNGLFFCFGGEGVALFKGSAVGTFKTGEACPLKSPLCIRGLKLLELPLAVFGPFGPKEKTDERGLASVDICLHRLRRF